MRRSFTYRAALFALALLIPSAGWAAISHVQGGASSTGTPAQSTIAVTLSAVASGDCVMGAVSWENDTGQTLSSVKDDKNNTYTVVDNVNDGLDPFTGSSFYLCNITNGPATITATASTTVNFWVLVVDEYSGVANALDAHTGNTQNNPTGTDSVTSTSGTTTANGDLIYGATFNAGSAFNPTAGTSFTLRQSIFNASEDYGFTEDRVQTSAGSVAATFTPPGNDTWITLMMAFKSTASVAGGGSLMLMGCCN